MAAASAASLLSSVGSFVSSALDFNKATLTGALDIIAVRYDDGSLRVTPFHVRFGKLKLLRSRDKLVRVLVDGAPTELVMRLGAAGEGYFIAPAASAPPRRRRWRRREQPAAASVGSASIRRSKPCKYL